MKKMSVAVTQIVETQRDLTNANARLVSMEMMMYPSIFVLLLVDLRQISIALKTCECVSLSLFFLFD